MIYHVIIPNLFGSTTRLQFSTTRGFQHCSNWQGYLKLVRVLDGSKLVRVLEVGVWASCMWYHVLHCQAHRINILFLPTTFTLPSGSQWCGFRRLSNLSVVDVAFLLLIHTPKVARFEGIQSLCIYIYTHTYLADSRNRFKHATWRVWSSIPNSGNPKAMMAV